MFNVALQLPYLLEILLSVTKEAFNLSVTPPSLKFA